MNPIYMSHDRAIGLSHEAIEFLQERGLKLGILDLNGSSSKEDSATVVHLPPSTINEMPQEVRQYLEHTPGIVAVYNLEALRKNGTN